VSWKVLLRELLEKSTGIVVSPGASGAHVEQFITGRVTALGLPDPETYLNQLLTQPQMQQEMRQLIALVAICHTWFFRDPEQLESIRCALTTGSDPSSRKYIWSAGCATGEETWSLAILCAEHNINAEILGTDLCESSIDIARSGLYSAWSLRRTRSDWRNRWFARHGDQYRVRDELRRNVRFGVQNLATDPLPTSQRALGLWDMVVCRNVLMYWSSAQTRTLLQAIVRLLGSHGWLFIGASESLDLRNIDLLHASLTAGRIGYRPGPPTASSPPPGPPGNVAQSGEPPTTAQARSESDSNAYDQALKHLRAGRWEQGHAALEALVAAHPDHLLAQLTLGNMYMRRHDWDRAVEVYSQVQARDPLSPELHYLLGVAYRRIGDWACAEEAFRRVLFLMPSFWPASFLLACTSETAGKQDIAAREFARTLELVQSPAGPMRLQSFPHDLDILEVPPGEIARTCRERLESNTPIPSTVDGKLAHGYDRDSG
jgi:chemotaxis protein methyltransferase CheR